MKIEMELPESDYPEIGEFVYKFHDILIKDKLPEGEEKNIARVLLEYQQYIEYIFEHNISTLYSLVAEYCNNEYSQNSFAVSEIKSFVLYNFSNINSKYIKESISRDIDLQKKWETFRGSNNKLPRDLPEELTVDSLTSKTGYIEILGFLKRYTNKNVDDIFI